MVNVVEKQCVFTRFAFMLCLCAMSHDAALLAFRLDLLQQLSFLFQLDISH